MNPLNITWNPTLIAASISIVDKNKIYTFREFDITEFLNSLLREGKILKLDNSIESKILWVHLFNFIFKHKNILVPSERDALENYEISWTIVFDTCDVLEGTEVTIDLKK